jgi:hypothetical protein
MELICVIIIMILIALFPFAIFIREELLGEHIGIFVFLLFLIFLFSFSLYYTITKPFKLIKETVTITNQIEVNNFIKINLPRPFLVKTQQYTKSWSVDMDKINYNIEDYKPEEKQ